jgi:stage IV sporulation protein FB
VLLAEPSTSEYDLHFRLLGYPVRIHPYFWLVTLFMGPLKEPAIFSVMWVVAVLLCILLHELGHAVVMKFYGFFPAIVLYSFGGLAIPRRGPYNARRPGPWGDILIAFGGPASGFILTAILVASLHYLGGCPVIVFEPTWREVVPIVLVPNVYLMRFLYDIFYITVWWGLVNLLPIYPLDGGQISQQLFYLNNPQDAIRPSLILSVIVGGLLTVYFVMQMLNMKEGFDWHEFYLAAFFGYLTYSNYESLQSMRFRGGW